MEKKNLLYKLGLALIPNVGNSLAHNLISHVGSVDEIFREKPALLSKIPGIGPKISQSISNPDILQRAEQEIRFIEKNKISYIFFLDEDYPFRLKNCQDAPILLFYKGILNSYPRRTLSIIGTRNPSTRGKKITRDWVREISERDKSIVIISGLAYGIDIQAHEAALDYGLKTYAGLGHGFHTIYPAIHRSVAKKITGQGALITDFFSYSKMEPKNFIRRNRLIAGLSDATLVVESKEKGGAMVTADMAGSYNRDVFVIPGRPSDPMSRGCNKLIKLNEAALVETVDDLFFLMAWGNEEMPEVKGSDRIMQVLSEDEKQILSLLTGKTMSADQLSYHGKIPVPRLSAILLSLEFKELIAAKPGNSYARTN